MGVSISVMIMTLLLSNSETLKHTAIQYNLANIRGNQSQAERVCSQAGSFLPFSDAYSDYSNLKDYVKKYNVRKSWIGIRKKIYNTPHWINSSVVAENLLPSGKLEATGKQCGYLSVFMHIDIAKCSQANNDYGTLCMKNCEECELVNSMCFKYGPKCFLIFCGQYNWFSAKKLCQTQGADLAILPNQEYVNKTAKYIEERKNPCRNFWIGMSTMSWNGKNGEVMQTWDWANPEPTTPGKCVYMQQGSGWHSANCSETHDIICSKRVYKHTYSTTLTTADARIPSKQTDTLPTCKECNSHMFVFAIDRTTLTVCLILSTAALCILAAASLYCCYRTCTHGWKIKDMCSGETENKYEDKKKHIQTIKLY